MITDLEQLRQQEQTLQFSRFDNEDAWQLGCLIKRRAEQAGVNVAIDITRNGLCLFRYAMPNTAPDNQHWMERKRNVVERYLHSSWYMGQYYLAKGKSIEQASLVKESQFAPHGGSFPLIIKNVGVVGSITVSGLPQYEDHKLVVDSISEFLSE